MLFREREFREREQLNKLGIYLLFVQQDGGVIQLTKRYNKIFRGGPKGRQPWLRGTSKKRSYQSQVWIPIEVKRVWGFLGKHVVGSLGYCLESKRTTAVEKLCFV